MVVVITVELYSRKVGFKNLIELLLACCKGVLPVFKNLLSEANSQVVPAYNSAGLAVLYINKIPPTGTGTKDKAKN